MQNIRIFLDSFKGVDTYHQQNEAVLELLIWTMSIDKTFSLIEDEKIQQFIEKADWDSVFSSDDCVKDAITKVRNTISDSASASRLLSEINRKLQSVDMKNRAIKACRALAGADGEFCEEEKKFLDEIKKALSVKTNY